MQRIKVQGWPDDLPSEDIQTCAAVVFFWEDGCVKSRAIGPPALVNPLLAYIPKALDFAWEANGVTQADHDAAETLGVDDGNIVVTKMSAKMSKRDDSERKKPSLAPLEKAFKDAEEKGFCSWCGGIEHTGECSP